MAKADFHKNQRVFVKPVGTWALVERVKPQWVKGVEEPIRIFYEVGLGRDFSAHELVQESDQHTDGAMDCARWRIMRAPNKWRSRDECEHHPLPGTFPVVVTDANDWGGWRVPGAEYDRDPAKVEFEARIIVSSVRLLRIATELSTFSKEHGVDLPSGLKKIVEEAEAIRRHIYDEPDDFDAGDETVVAAE